MPERDDGVEGKCAIFEAIVDAGSLLGVPRSGEGDDHVDGAATEVAALVEEVSS